MGVRENGRSPQRTQVAILNEQGKGVMNRNVPNDAGELAMLIGNLGPDTPVAFEAAYEWSWLVDPLETLELEPHLAHPGGCKAIASSRRKNDRVDARSAPERARCTRKILRMPASVIACRWWDHAARRSTPASHSLWAARSGGTPPAP